MFYNYLLKLFVHKAGAAPREPLMPTSQIKRCAPEVNKWLIGAITSYESSYCKDNK